MSREILCYSAGTHTVMALRMEILEICWWLRYIPRFELFKAETTTNGSSLLLIPHAASLLPLPPPSTTSANEEKPEFSIWDFVKNTSHVAKWSEKMQNENICVRRDDMKWIFIRTREKSVKGKCIILAITWVARILIKYLISWQMNDY